MENNIYEKTMLCLALSLLSVRLANYMLLLDKNLPLTSSTTWTLGYAQLYCRYRPRGSLFPALRL